MALSMIDTPATRIDKTRWPTEVRAEFERQSGRPNGCVGNKLISETDKVGVWTIRLKPGKRFGFHRHVFNYFWSAITSCRGRQHLTDGSTVEYAYAPGETCYGTVEFKVHDLENIGDTEMVFMTVEFLDGANKPLTIPEDVRRVAA
jgi:beta-alanine degradation protein BauB